MNAVWARIEFALTRGDLIPPGSGAVVAVSGGRDSMVLLSALDRCRVRQGWRVVVAHFHHQLRGAEADADQALVAVTAARSGLAFIAGTANVEAMRAPAESWETAARRLRHAFLARVAREQGCARVALGHHAGDQAELFLLRLLRGAGAAGLSGMREGNPSPADPGIVLVRPMLQCRGQDVEDLANAWRVEFRIDASNCDTAYLRNRVRHELIPLLESRYQSALERVLLREQVLLRDQADFMEATALEWLKPAPDRRQGRFDTLAVALQREVVRVQAAHLSLSLDFDSIEFLREQPDRPMQIRPGRRVVRDSTGNVRVLESEPKVGGGDFLPHERELRLNGGGGVETFGGGTIAWQISGVPHQGPALSPIRELDSPTTLECLDADAVGRWVRLRHWRPGDRFQIIGLGAAAKLQDLFTNARVPVVERRQRVVAETEHGEVFWVEGLRIGECAKIRPSTVRTLTWRWDRSEG